MKAPKVQVYWKLSEINVDIMAWISCILQILLKFMLKSTFARLTYASILLFVMLTIIYEVDNLFIIVLF
jgi:hypothetical protein